VEHMKLTGSYIGSVVKSIVVIGIIASVPWVCHQAGTTKKSRQAAPGFKLGAESLSSELIHSLIPTRSNTYAAGLVTNVVGAEGTSLRVADLLRHYGVPISTMFVPQQEQGVTLPTSNAEIAVYGWPLQGPIPLAARTALAGLAIVFVDIQDMGMREGCGALLLPLMRQAAQHHCTVVVLDRPNVLGSGMEGSVVAPGVTTNIPVPVRHGMTIGELARYCNTHVLTQPVDLRVVPMQAYRRSASYTKPQCVLSQGTPLAAWYGYSFLSLLREVTPLDVGIGTENAYQCILLPERLKFPKHAWYDLQELLKNYGIESKWHHCFNTQQRQYYSGLRVQVSDIDHVSSLRVVLALLTFFKDAGINLSFSPRFDAAVGTTSVRACIQGSLSREQLAHEIHESLQLFYSKARDSFMYAPFPRLTKV